MSRVPYTKEVAQLKSLSLKRKEATSTHVAITEKNICQTNHMYINKGYFPTKVTSIIDFTESVIQCDAPVVENTFVDDCK